MTQVQKEQFEKFKQIAGWMYGDSKKSLWCVGASFLVVMGIFNYIETLGAFLIGYWQKENGQIKKDRKGKDLLTTSKEKFNNFFISLGQEYENLIKTHQDKVFDELRCGLTHHYLPKNRKFCIYGIACFDWKNPADVDRLTNEQIKNMSYKGVKVNCGVVLDSEQVWQIYTPYLLADFEDGVKSFIKKIEDNNDKKLISNFFETANEVNLQNYIMS